MIEAFPEKVWVELNKNIDQSSADESQLDKVELQFRKRLEPFPEFWDGDEPFEGARDRTFKVTLGVRTPESTDVGAYVFEIVITGAFACVAEKVGAHSPEDAAYEYGLTMLYGMVREQFAAITSRMLPGIRMLPTLSFIGEREHELKAKEAEQAMAK
ncbi:hypothetical protein [Aquabacterium sp.]|uniref:hypothetical protein n=1 Tax=Aquabacterium sp. TaxID=1872578 RepID=UPI0035B3F783